VSVTDKEPVTPTRYGAGAVTPKHAFPTPVTQDKRNTVTPEKRAPVTPSKSVTDSGPVTVELSQTVTAKKPLRKAKTVTPERVIKVSATKAVIISPRTGEKETVTKDQVGARKRSNYRNIEKRKTKSAKERCKQLGDFYADLEKQMRDA